MKRILAIAAVLLFTGAAVAQHKHGDRGPNGGPMEDVAGVHAELLTTGNVITINVLDENNKPLKTAGYTASALIVSGPDRETVRLEPADDTALKGQAKKPIAANTQITLMLKTAAGKSGQARFKVERK
jgi:hypothetical protein